MMVNSLRQDMIEKLSTTSMSILEKYETGDLIQRHDGNIFGYIEIAFAAIPVIINIFLIIATIFFAGFIMNWRLVPACFLLAPFPIIFNLISKRLSATSKKIMIQTSQGNSYFKGILNALALVKASNAENQAVSKYKEVYEGIYKNNLRVGRIQIILNRIGAANAFLMYFALFLWSVYLFFKRWLTLGDIAVVSFMFRQCFFMPIDQIFSFMQRYRYMVPGIERFTEIINQPSETPTDIAALSGISHIEFKDVGFTYDDGTHALENVSALFSQNQVTAVVGKSGSGKSTLVKLICGLYTPQKGNLTISDSDADNTQWRSLIGYVPQSPFLLPVSIKDNIGYGLKDATVEQIEKTIKDLHLESFIESLPQGYETIVHAGGMSLSGGQKQLVALARAWIKQVPILILDEPSSALDAETESEIKEILSIYKRGRIVVVISHRMSLVRDADKIVVLDKGCVRENGTHAELLEKQGHYAALYMDREGTN